MTKRQREVMLLLAKGYTGAEVAEKLRVSPSAIYVQKAAVLESLGLLCIADLTLYCVQHRLIDGTLGFRIDVPIKGELR